MTEKQLDEIQKANEYFKSLPKEKQDAVVAILKTSGLDNKLGKGLVAQTLKAITDA